jgi:tetratricopeptide (TPR) repeat protein
MGRKDRARLVVVAPVILLVTTVELHAAPPTFDKDIAPIVWTQCATCHRQGEIGPFSLMTYAEVKAHAGDIAKVTSQRIMPPWKPTHGKGDFLAERRLTDEQIAIIRQWVADGAPEGNASDLPPRPEWHGGWELGTPDLVVTMPEAFQVPAGGPDIFRTFVIAIPTTRPRYVKALVFKPDNPRVVHHANIGIDRTGSSRLQDERDPGPGYSGGMVEDARYPDGQLLGWTPGQTAHTVPDGTAWLLEPGSDVVVQAHIRPRPEAQSLKVSVGFYFTDKPPTLTPVGLRLGSETIDIPPGDADYEITDSYVLPVDVKVLAVQPHAHNLGHYMEAKATLPDGSTRWLIEIKDWDFMWQDVYRYKEPIELPKGSVISMRYTYDNSNANPHNPHHPPVRVVWGQNTTDEMGDFWIQVVTKSDDDAKRLRADFQRKVNAEDLAAYTKLLQEDPENPLRHDAVGDLELQGGRLDDAIAQYRESLKLNPNSASTHYDLGFALSLQGKREEAVTEFETSVRLQPDNAQAQNNLGALLELLGRPAEALDHLRRAVALKPDSVDAQVNLGQFLSAGGQSLEAANHFEAALKQRPDSPPALAGLAWIRATAADASLRDPAEAVRLAERAASLTNRRDLSVLDALAAAYAASNRFEDAVLTVESAMDLAQAAGLSQAVGTLRQRLALYQQHQLYRMPSR